MAACNATQCTYKYMYRRFIFFTTGYIFESNFAIHVETTCNIQIIYPFDNIKIVRKSKEIKL